MLNRSARSFWRTTPPRAHEDDFTLAIGALAHDGRQMPGKIADNGSKAVRTGEEVAP